MVRVYVTKKVAKVINNLRNDKKYFEVMAFMANVQEATMEARSYLTQEQAWDLFSAIKTSSVYLMNWPTIRKGMFQSASICLRKTKLGNLDSSPNYNR